MKTFELPTGETVTVDDADFDHVMKFRWYRRRKPCGTTYVLAAHRADGRVRTVYIHRIILGSRCGDVVDHIDGNPLNNCRDNLRVGTHRTNIRAFQRKRERCSSCFRGVWRERGRTSWRAAVTVRTNNRFKKHRLGSFASELAAAKAYNEKALELGFMPEALNKVA